MAVEEDSDDFPADTLETQVSLSATDFLSLTQKCPSSGWQEDPQGNRGGQRGRNPFRLSISNDLGWRRGGGGRRGIEGPRQWDRKVRTHTGGVGARGS